MEFSLFADLLYSLLGNTLQGFIPIANSEKLHLTINQTFDSILNRSGRPIPDSLLNQGPPLPILSAEANQF